MVESSPGIAPKKKKGKGGGGGVFKMMKVKAVTRSGRGGSVQDPNVIIEVIKDEQNWNLITEALASQSGDETSALVDHFNDLCPDDIENLGEILFGEERNR